MSKLLWLPVVIGFLLIIGGIATPGPVFGAGALATSSLAVIIGAFLMLMGLLTMPLYRRMLKRQQLLNEVLNDYKRQKRQQ